MTSRGLQITARTIVQASYTITYIGDFDVMEGRDSFGILKNHQFCALTNFSFAFKCKVIPPPDFKQFCGFVVEVAVTNGMHRHTGPGRLTDFV